VELSLLRGLARLAFERDDLCGLTGASPERFFEARGLTVLSQEVAERFVGELLEGLHAFRGQQPKLLPRLFVKLDAFANHGLDPGSQRTHQLCELIRGWVIIFRALRVLFQLALARFRQLLPGLGHLLKMLAMRRRGGPGHVPTFCSVLKVFV